MSRSQLFGVLNIDKPHGLTSRQVVNQVQRLVRPAKCGHAGTLDPLATGVLVVCVGPATRLIQHVQQMPKVYRGRFRLGLTSDTDDITGELQTVRERPEVARADVESALHRFVGLIDQVPPRFSAVHVAGRRAHELARRGQNFQLASRQVRVDRCELTEFSLDEIELEIECGSGTYVRSIGRDLGEILGCGAVMTELRRTRIGVFEVGQSVQPEQLDQHTLASWLQPPHLAVSGLPTCQAREEDRELIATGRPIPVDAETRSAADALVFGSEGEREWAVIGPEGQLWCLGLVSKGARTLQPRQVFVATNR